MDLVSPETLYYILSVSKLVLDSESQPFQGILREDPIQAARKIHIDHEGQGNLEKFRQEARRLSTCIVLQTTHVFHNTSQNQCRKIAKGPNCRINERTRNECE